MESCKGIFETLQRPSPLRRSLVSSIPDLGKLFPSLPRLRESLLIVTHALSLAQLTKMSRRSCFRASRCFPERLTSFPRTGSPAPRVAELPCGERDVHTLSDQEQGEGVADEPDRRESDAKAYLALSATQARATVPCAASSMIAAEFWVPFGVTHFSVRNPWSEQGRQTVRRHHTLRLRGSWQHETTLGHELLGEPLIRRLGGPMQRQ